VTFGDTPSPFLFIATVQKHAKEHEEDHPTAAKEVSANMFVDDVLTGAPEDDSTVTLECTRPVKQRTLAELDIAI